MKKNIVHYVTGQYMKQNKKRTFTTFFGIVFMVLLMTCVFVGKNTGLSFMEQVAEKKDGKWHVSFYGTDQEGFQAIKNVDYVEQTAASASFGNLEFSQSRNADRPYLTVKAYTKNCFDWMNIELAEGRLPENSSEIVLSESAVKDGAGVKLGDRISGELFRRSITGIDEEVKKTVFPFFNLTLKYGETVEVPQNFPYYRENKSFRENKLFTGETGVYEVVGIIKKPGFETESSAGYTAIAGLDEAEAKALQTLNVSVKLDLYRVPELFGAEFQEIADCEKIEFNDYLLAFSGSSSDTSVNRMIGFMMVFFILLIMAASVVLIYNVFNISFRERCRYLGMLSSVGATGRQKRSSIYYEAFTLLLPALPAGILLGMAVIKTGITAIKPLLGEFMKLEAYVQDTRVELVFSMKDIAVIVLVSTVTVLISAFLPARKIGKIGPIASIRGNKETKDRQYSMKIPATGILRGEAMLAGITVKRQRKKTKSLTVAAVAFMVIMAVTSYGAAAVNALVTARIMDSGDMTVTSDKWDYRFGSIGSKESEEQFEAVKEEILKHPGVSDAALWYDGMFSGRVSSETYSEEYKNAVHEIFNLYYHRKLSDEEFEEKSGVSKTETLCVIGVDEETLLDIAKKAGADTNLLKDKEKASAIVVRSGEVSTANIIASENAPERFRYFHIENMTDLKQGENIDVESNSAVQNKDSVLPVTIAGFADEDDYKDYLSFKSQFLWLIVGENTCLKMRELSDSHMTPSLHFKWDGKDTAFLEKLESLCEENYELYFGDFNTTKRFGDAIIDIVNIMAVCFTAVVSLICLLNLFNSIRGRLMERRSEFAILQSVGMTSQQLGKMLFLENIRILGRSLMISAVLSGGMIAVLRMGMEKIFGHVELVLPWGYFAGCICITMLAVCGITWGCFIRDKDRKLMAWRIYDSISG